MSCEALRVLYFKMSGVGAHAQRRVLPAAGAQLRAGLAGVVLHAAAVARRARQDAAPRQDGQGDQHRAAHQLRFHIAVC